MVAILLTLSGDATFYYNSARYGAALRLLNTIVFICKYSQLYFHQNTAVELGGAIDVFNSNTNIRFLDICPIQFIGSNSDNSY